MGANVISDRQHWDSGEEVQKLISSVEDLRSLYWSLGYDPRVYRESRRILTEMEALMRTDIPDFQAFQNALSELQQRMEGHKDGQGLDVPLGATKYYVSIITVKDDKAKVLDLLNQMSFYERALGPIGSLLQHRPMNPDRFKRLIAELTELFQDRWIPQKKDVRQNVLGKIADVEKEFNLGEHGYLPGSIIALRQELVNSCWTLLRDQAVGGKKEQLDRLLSASVFATHEYKPGHFSLAPAAPIARERFSEMARENARLYLDSPWMHAPWLTVRVQTDLLDSVLGPRNEEVRLATYLYLFACGACLISFAFHFSWRVLEIVAFLLGVSVVWGFWGERKTWMLKHIRSEIVSRCYDGEVVARRLQRLEEKGVPVPSVLYPLVRLGMGKEPKEAR
jgi:hypothetical protein